LTANVVVRYEEPSNLNTISSSSLNSPSPETPANVVNDAGDVLTVTDVHSAYGGVKAVNGVTFSVKEGECIGIIGPNGAGKSTLLDNISGVNANYTGQIRMFGRDVSRWPLHRRAQLGVARSFQAPRMFGRMSVLSNLMVAPQRQPGESTAKAIFGGWQSTERQQLQRARGLLARFGLNRVADSYARELSGGQERLLELARALMCYPRLLLLDEPFAGVSPSNRQILVHHLSDLATSENLSIVMIEHRLEWVEQICDHVIVMALGKVLARGTLAEVVRERSVVDAYLGRTQLQ
jgi:ABC-type branched-subunit amino acid transport system ATPase component